MSLRDVDRTLQVMMWFYEHKRKLIFELMDRKAAAEANVETVGEGELAPFEVVLFFVYL